MLRRAERYGHARGCGRSAALAAGAAVAAGGALGGAGATDRTQADEPRGDRACARPEASLDRGAATTPSAAAGSRGNGGESIGGADRRARWRELRAWLCEHGAELLAFRASE